MAIGVRGYLVIGWLFGTFVGSMFGGFATASGLADTPMSHPRLILTVGLGLCIVGCLSALALVQESRTAGARGFALGAAVLSFVLPPLVICPTLIVG